MIVGQFMSVLGLLGSLNWLYYKSNQQQEVFMKIESKAIIRRRIRNIEQDIQSVRNSGNTLRMRVLYAQLTASIIKLQNMKN